MVARKCVCIHMRCFSFPQHMTVLLCIGWIFVGGTGGAPLSERACYDAEGRDAQRSGVPRALSHLHVLGRLGLSPPPYYLPLPLPLDRSSAPAPLPRTKDLLRSPPSPYAPILHSVLSLSSPPSWGNLVHIVRVRTAGKGRTRQCGNKNTKGICY